MSTPLTSDELVAKAKAWLTISEDFPGETLKLRVLAAKGALISFGVPEDKIESDEGIAAICVLTTDLWDVTAGEVKISPAFGFLLAGLKPGL